jgi:hypothetical protein
VYNFPTLFKLIPLDGDILGPLDNTLDWDSLDGCFGNDLRDILSQILDGVVVNFGNLPWDGFHIPPFLILSDGPLMRNPLSPFSDLIVGDPLLEGNVLNSALA